MLWIHLAHDYFLLNSRIMGEIFSVLSIVTCLGVSLMSLGFLHLRGSWALFGVSTTMLIWQFGKLATIYSASIHLNPFWCDYISLVGAIWIPYFILLLARLSSTESQVSKRFYLSAIFPLGFSLLQLNSQVVAGFSIYEWGIQHQAGTFYGPFLFFYVTCFGLGLYWLLPRSWWGNPLLRAQQISTGVAALLGISLGFFDFLNTLFGFQFTLANLAPLIFSAALGWSMYKIELVEKAYFYKKTMIYIWSFLGFWLFLEFIQKIWQGIPLTGSLPLWVIALGTPLLFGIWTWLMRYSNPVGIIASHEWEVFQIWLSRNNSSEQLMQGLVQLAQERGYTQVRAILCHEKQILWESPSPLTLTENLLDISLSFRKILHIRALFHSLRFGKSSMILAQELHKQVQFLNSIEADIWLPLVHRGQLYGVIWMKDAPFVWRQFTKEIKTLETIISSASARLALFEALEENHQKERLAEIGFLTASLAHQLKNPLEGVIGALEVWKEVQSPEMIAIAEKEARRLEDRITLFLDWTKTVELQPESMEITEWLKDLLSPRWEIHSETKVHAQVDKAALIQIVEILDTNAQRHAPQAEWILTIKAEKDFVLLMFGDSGTGVQDEKNLFKPFKSTHSQGHGLGLALAHKLALAMHGQLNYQKSPWGGAQFNLKLPLGYH